jgi:hypothetical protein
MSNNNCYFSYKPDSSKAKIVALKNPLKSVKSGYTNTDFTEPIYLNEGLYTGTNRRQEEFNKFVSKLELDEHTRLYLQDNIFNSKKLPSQLENLRDKVLHFVNLNSGQTIYEPESDFYPFLDMRSCKENSDVKPRLTMSVFGMNGSGKSYFSDKIARMYKAFYPENPIYIFSCVAEDSGGLFKFSEDIHTVEINPENFLDPETAYTRDDMENSLCIFDDIENISDRLLAKEVYNFRDACLNKGRHQNISVISIFHNALAGAFSKIIHQESENTTIFPRGSIDNNMKFLTKKLGMSVPMAKGLIDKYSKISRWVCISNKYPSFVVHEHGLDIL